MTRVQAVSCRGNVSSRNSGVSARGEPHGGYRSLGARIVVVACALLTSGTLDAQGPQVRTLDFSSAQSLRAESLLTIDGYAADLVPVRWLTVSGDHHVYVAQEQDFRILIFDSLGVRVAAIGGRGQGPGEFENLVVAGFVQDTLWFYDGIQSRLTFVSPGGEVVRTAQWPRIGMELPRYGPLSAPITFSLFYFRALLQDRTVAAALLRPSSMPAGGSSEGFFYGIINDDGIVQTLIGQMPDQPPPVRDGGVLLYGTTPLDQNAYLVTSPEGGRTAFLSATLRGSNAGAFEAVVVSNDGSRIFGLNGRSPRPIEGLVMGRDHSLWLRSSDTEQAHYHVVDREGSLIGRMSFPLNVTIKVVDTGGNPWALVKDDLGVESIVRFAVIR